MRCPPLPKLRDPAGADGQGEVIREERAGHAQSLQLDSEVVDIDQEQDRRQNRALR